MAKGFENAFIRQKNRSFNTVYRWIAAHAGRHPIVASTL
jgi:hypothetical protein